MSEAAKVQESVQCFGRKVGWTWNTYRVIREQLTCHWEWYREQVDNWICVLYLWQKTATAVAFVKKGAGLIKVNGVPISLLQPEILKLKTFEPVLLIGTDKFANVSLFKLHGVLWYMLLSFLCEDGEILTDFKQRPLRLILESASRAEERRLRYMPFVRQ